MDRFPKAHANVIQDFVRDLHKHLMTESDNPHDVFNAQFKQAMGILQERMAGAEADALQQVMQQLRTIFVNGINDMLKAGEVLNTTNTTLDINRGRQGYLQQREVCIHEIASQWVQRLGNQRRQMLQQELEQGYVMAGDQAVPLSQQEKDQIQAQLREGAVQLGHEADLGDLNRYVLGVLRGDQDRNSFWTEHIADFFTDNSNTDWDRFFDEAKQRLDVPERNLQEALGYLAYLGSGPWQQFTSAFDQATTPGAYGGPGIGGIPGLPPFGGLGDGGGFGDGGSGGGAGDGGYGDGGGAGAGAGGYGGGSGGLFPPPSLAAMWLDQQPDQFPQPHDMQDLVSEIIRRQGGRHHLLLITHYGAPSQNTWLVTIADRGNKNFTQDPGDPGGYQDTFGSSGSDGGMSLSGASTAGAGGTAGDLSSGPYTDSGSRDADLYLNNTPSIRTELAGRLSPYGQFVAEAIQKYCTSQPADPSGATSGDTPLAPPTPDGGASEFGGGVFGSIANAALRATAPKLTCPPTSPQSPARILLAGHGLGGMVAQNLAAQKPFPGDNPTLAPAHIVAGVIAFGAPIVGKFVPGISYDFFTMPGDRVGDIPVETVGVNDERAHHVHTLKNPFLSAPWQSGDPTKPHYIKDPNDPQAIHSAYADSEVLKHTKLPFDLKGAGQWGPTYVIVIPQTSTPLSGDTGASTPMGQSPATVGAPVDGTSS